MSGALSLKKGGNLALGAIDSVESLLVGLTWEAGGLDCDVCALVCSSDRKVLSDGHFLFWNQPVSPERAVFLRVTEVADKGVYADRAQLLLDLAALPNEADRIVVTFATIVEGATLAALRSLRLRVLDPTTGGEFATYSIGNEIAVEACLIVAEVYRHGNQWKLRAVGQGYAEGLAGLGTNYGVNIL